MKNKRLGWGLQRRPGYREEKKRRKLLKVEKNPSAVTYGTY